MSFSRDFNDGSRSTQGDGPLNVTVLMGGPSDEREVSLMSGKAVSEALRAAGHNVTCADISARDCSALDAEGIDVVFIALHGDFGESGRVQELCEQRCLRYIGSGPKASELALDKAAAKQLFRQAGLVTPDWMIIEQFHPPELYRKWLEEIPVPAVVKPVCGGSSIDVTIARTDAARDAAIEDVLDKHGRVLIERFVAGREFTVGILGNDALPVLEVIPPGEFYDYSAKYDDDATRYVFDHALDEAKCEEIRQAALTAHQVLGCRDLSRVDFILDADGCPQVLELNTIPGFTGHSLFPKAAAKVGLSFERLADSLVRMAMAHELTCADVN
jgi:D-alanine-D-alanine ligase